MSLSRQLDLARNNLDEKGKQGTGLDEPATAVRNNWKQRVSGSHRNYQGKRKHAVNPAASRLHKRDSRGEQKLGRQCLSFPRPLSIISRSVLAKPQRFAVDSGAIEKGRMAGTKLALYGGRQTPRPRKTCYISRGRWFLGPHLGTSGHRSKATTTGIGNGRSRSGGCSCGGWTGFLVPASHDHYLSSKRCND